MSTAYPLQSDLTEPLQQSHLVDLESHSSRQPRLHQVPFTPDIVFPTQGDSYLISETPGKASTKRNVWSLFPVFPFPTPGPQAQAHYYHFFLFPCLCIHAYFYVRGKRVSICVFAHGGQRLMTSRVTFNFPSIFFIKSEFPKHTQSLTV